MKHPVFAAALFIFISLFFTACEKEYSYEGGPGGPVVPTGSSSGTAVYSLSGGTSSCTGAVVSGNYFVGTPTTSANTVTLTVTVDAPGTYLVSTNTLFGVNFSGSGSFTSTGTQNIVLTASGTPTLAGTFNYVAGSSGCRFSVTVDPAPPIDNSYTYFYEATVDGTYHKETVTTSNGYEAGYGTLGVDDVVLFSDILPASYPPMPAGKTGLSVSKGILYNYATRNNTEFKTFFNLGNYNYISTPSMNDGVNVTWYDQDGKEWSTQNPPADQTGSSFEIVNVTEVSTTPVFTISVTFQFNCKLYDESGNVKTLTNGKLKGLLGKE